MKQRLALLSVMVTAALFSGCGGDSSGAAAVTGSGGNPSAMTTYRLTAAASPTTARDGSFIGTKIPPEGTTGLRADIGVSGTLQVVNDVPTGDLVLDQRIIGFEFASLDTRILPDISAQGEDLGRIQLHGDGTLFMTLQLPIMGITFDLSIYNPAPHQYRFEGGQLFFRGVTLETPAAEPYFGTPLVFLWADPER